MVASWAQRREVAPETSRLLIARAHEELVAGNPADARLADVREVVRDSWRRSLASDVGAEGLPPLAFTLDALDEYRRAHPLAGVIEMIRGLLLPDRGEDSGVVIAVGDAAGRLLWVEGDRGLRSRTEDMGFVAGANWSEASVGTSAPGLALAIGASVQVHGAEHFNRFVQPWSCTAAPVRDPETRQIIGVIDVTGGAEAVTPQAQLLVDAAARAVEGELLVTRLRAAQERPKARRRIAPRSTRAAMRVLGRSRALLDIEAPDASRTVELSLRHAELLLMLVAHRQGLSAERLAELVYGSTDAADTVRPELVRLRKAIAAAGHLELESRPYRLTGELETDAHRVLSLLDRGAHRVALAAYRGDVLPDSTAPGVEEVRERVRTTLRDALIAEASVDVLLEYVDTDLGENDAEVLRLCLELLPARSPKRAGIVTRLEALG